MSRHAADPTQDTLESERFAAQMARTHGRRQPLPGFGRHRDNSERVTA